MLLVDDILLFPVHSIMWMFREIGKIAQDELAGEAQSITEQLRILYMELETGRISEQEFETAEKALLDRLEGIDNRLREEEDPGQLDSLETQGELGGTEGTGGPS